MKIEDLKLNKKLLIALSLIVILPLLILVIIKLTPSHRDIAKMNKLSKEIKECNLTLNKAINDQSIDSEKSEALLSSGIVKLKELDDELFATTVVQKNQAIKEKLYETLTYNINIYELTLGLIRNPNDKEIISKFNEYTKTYNLLVSNYKDLKSSGLKVDFPDSTKKFFDNSSYFINAVIKINRETDIKVDQKKAYVVSLEECINAFSEIDEDLKPALEKIKEDGRSLEVLLKDIKDKKSKFSEIKSKSYSLTIPEKGNDCYEILQDTITFYDLYITSLEHSIILEKSSSNANDDENIGKNYNNSFSKYSDFTKSLKELNAELDNFNNK
ncbi:hypothetical protein ACQPU1_15060 [Clostridium paraputrificum]|uniref:hypothetical protein n=1 Tax=Clostridium TaxID=1485 RepID=UPI003D324CD5